MTEVAFFFWTPQSEECRIVPFETLLQVASGIRRSVERVSLAGGTLTVKLE